MTNGSYIWAVAAYSLMTVPADSQLANIETAKRQNRLFDALKQGQVAPKELQQEVRCLQPMHEPL